MVFVQFEDWGLISYEDALLKQSHYQSKLVNFKLALREKEIKQDTLKPENEQEFEFNKLIIPNQYLIFCEHPPVFTFGNRKKVENLLLNDLQLKAMDIQTFPIRRGGDITFHGPGQIVGYPILDLEKFFTDIHRYLRTIEEAIIKTLEEFEIKAGRIQGLSGVWVESEDSSKARKICAIGVHCSRWVTMHGFAINVNTDLEYFNYIIPCGIKDKGVTSMKKELGFNIPIENVKSVLMEKLAMEFGIVYDQP